jgi:endonuclease/exonuclease/phosphatase family metal-dependent hydrolase
MSYIVAFGKKLYSRGLFLLLFLSLSSPTLSAQQRIGIAFWNVENLYDTIPSPFYDDREWTPRGANRWDTARYRTKLANLARVIDDLGADIVALAEVENEAVVRDLVTTLRTNYNYIHRTSADPRGIDLALLYKGDLYFPDDTVNFIYSGTGRGFLHVRGELSGKRVDLVVCHMASRLNSDAVRRRNMQALRDGLEKLLVADPAANIVVMGDMNAPPDERLVRRTLGPMASPWDFVYSPHGELTRTRQGSYNWHGRWLLYDWMAVSPAIARGGPPKIAGAGIFAKEYMVTTDAGGRKTPLRTFGSGDYLGGYSDHFPVYLILESDHPRFHRSH